ncbi:MAG: DUF3140 domain-containing protein [Leeuwenhoekiella sp.]
MHSKDRIYKDLLAQINMSPAELRAWLRTDLAPITVANYSNCIPIETSRKLLKIISKSESEINSADFGFIKQFLQRLLYLKRATHLKNQNRNDWENSLRNMGYDVRKAKRTSMV